MDDAGGGDGLRVSDFATNDEEGGGEYVNYVRNVLIASDDHTAHQQSWLTSRLALTAAAQGLALPPCPHPALCYTRAL